MKVVEKEVENLCVQIVNLVYGFEQKCVEKVFELLFLLKKYCKFFELSLLQFFFRL